MPTKITKKQLAKSLKEKGLKLPHGYEITKRVKKTTKKKK
jgi:hypothetical protein